MPDSDPPHTPNWADYIDSLHVFNPPSLPMMRLRRKTFDAEQAALLENKVNLGVPDDDGRAVR